MNGGMSSLWRRRLILGAFASSLVLAGVAAGFTAAPALADDRDHHDDRDRHVDRRDHRDHDHDRRVYVAPAPAYVEAPPPVYAPPPPPVGVSLFFPIHIR